MSEQELIELGHKLVDAALDCGADQAEAAASWQRSTETSLENGQVHSVQSSEETTFGLRVFVGSRLGFVTTNQTDDDSLRQSAAEAVEQAASVPADPLNDLVKPQPLGPDLELVDEAVSELDASYTTAKALELAERVIARDARVRIDSGSVEAARQSSAVVSSTGVEVCESATSIGSSLFGMAVDGQDVAGFDYDGEVCCSLAEFEEKAGVAADRFTDKCLTGLGAGTGKSFRGAIILSPEAVAELILPSLISSISADSIRKNRSPLADKLGQKIAIADFTLIEDGTRRGQVASSRFDREGVPLKARTLVDEGILQTFLFNHYEARAAGGDTNSTGNASGSASSLPSIAPSFLELTAGNTATADLSEGSETTLWVSRFSGSTNSITGEFSGVAKGGFLIEGGNRRPVREVLIAGNIYEMLTNISAIAKERRLLNGSALLPAMRVEGISVTAG